MDKRVETIKREVEDTLGDMNAKIEEIETRVHDSVDHVKERAQETVTHVREKIDVRIAVDKRPWTSLGASLAVGFILGRLGHSDSSDSDDIDENDYHHVAALPASSHQMNSYSRAPQQHEAVRALPAISSSSTSAPEYNEASPETSRAKEFTQRTFSQVKRKAPGILDSLRSHFSGEIEALKKAAIFSATNALREVLASKTPEFAAAFDRARDEEPKVAMAPTRNDSHETVYESKSAPEGYQPHQAASTQSRSDHSRPGA